VDTAVGDNGFGYDPIFFIPELGRTAAQLSMAEKNRVSHRALATFAIREQLRALA
jgi:XTP/dITP diphosphohydrolase